MSDKKDLYCSLAFNSISFGPHGGSRPCCAVDTFFWKEPTHQLANYKNHLPTWFNNQEMIDLRQDMLDGKWNPTCNLCKIREDVGQASTRQIFNHTLSQVEERTGRSWRENKAEVTDFSNIFLLDVTTGNKCNSACLMCNSSASSLWAKEQEEITGNAWTHPNLNWFNEENIGPIVDKLTNLKAIQFAGGEPTINDAVMFMLKKLIEQERSYDITLGFVTNLTGISDEMLDIWNKFNTKHITISIDGVDKVNEYIRYPFSWKKVTAQLDTLKKIAKEHRNYNIGLSHTITSLNLLSFGDLVKWWEETQVQDEGSGILKSLPHIQCVNNPSHFNPVYAPRALKDKTAVMLDELEVYLTDKNLLDKYRPAIENIRTNVINAKVDEKLRKAYWKRMRDFVEPLDRYRKRNIFDYLPYMKEFWSFE
jgi:sulfatase maturation enzyme AslB (radical SAM superfamily)